MWWQHIIYLLIHSLCSTRLIIFIIIHFISFSIELSFLLAKEHFERLKSLHNYSIKSEVCWLIRYWKYCKRNCFLNFCWMFQTPAATLTKRVAVKGRWAIQARSTRADVSKPLSMSWKPTQRTWSMADWVSDFSRSFSSLLPSQLAKRWDGIIHNTMPNLQWEDRPKWLIINNYILNCEHKTVF